MTPAARTQATLDLLNLLFPPEGGAGPPADRVLADYLRGRRYIGSTDRRTIAEQLYGVLRAHARLGWWLERLNLPGDNRIRLIAWLLLARHESVAAVRILFDGSHHGPEPLDASEVEAAKRLAGEAPGQVLDHPDQPLDVRHEVPAWLLPQLRAALGADLQRELSALAGEAPVDLRANTLKADRATVQAALAEAGIDSAVGRLSPWALRIHGRQPVAATQAFRDGLVEVQDEGSQVVAWLVGAKPGERVCDLCAGAGGKTLALAATMRNKGQIFACDTLKGRLDRSAVRLKRAGAFNVARRVLKSETDPWIKRHKAGFDRVLIDAPCSGTGAWRRNPDAKWRLTSEALSDLTALQGRLLTSAARLVKPGGRLVYATCSLLPSENQGQVERFLAVRGDFKLIPLAEAWSEALPGKPPTGGDTLLLRPAGHGTDGFFVAVLERQVEDAQVQNGQTGETERSQSG
ncbi:RsmB/NOP family class I SAM-dependent RNA methyltransferase [Algihabitans albus]|uniref:RsmB/NOP family class I SAM-dependent RNA methyltransferase n=1 Tax=Algihabitans albus TaxID=2164067 RepID=UPI000E5CCE43|nr:RsmB/NOP family class I SAM-dependent RNA methyltransferase [Algihabitans albus]